MPTLSKRLTNTTAAEIAAPEAGYLIHWCPKTPGFGLRVSATGDKAFVAERRVDGKTVRRTLGKATGPAAISADTARGLQVTISSELQVGKDRAVIKREARKVEREEGLTVADAVADYVKRKTNATGQHLKDRTKADYLGMVGENGGLGTIAHKSLHRLAADDIRAAHDAIRSQRQRVYAMQVLRAVLRWHGATVEASPLSPSTAGAGRIALPSTKGKPSPLKPDQLPRWWQAATARAGHPAADGLRLQLLTGCRPGEIFGSAFAPGLLVQDVDLGAATITLRDTKARNDHVVLLSVQARAIVAAHSTGKKPTDKVFGVLWPTKALAAINAEACTVGVSPHKLRHTFASVAARRVNAFALKALVNHSTKGDVTAEHYVGVSEDELRQAWQTVADAIAPRATAPVSGVPTLLT